MQIFRWRTPFRGSYSLWVRNTSVEPYWHKQNSVLRRVLGTCEDIFPEYSTGTIQWKKSFRKKVIFSKKSEMVKIVPWRVAPTPITAGFGRVSSFEKKHFLGSKLAYSCSLTGMTCRMSHRRPPKVCLPQRYDRLNIGPAVAFSPLVGKAVLDAWRCVLEETFSVRPIDSRNVFYTLFCSFSSSQASRKVNFPRT